MSRPVGTAAPKASAADTWISRAASVTVAALAGLAGAISYSHMRQLAQQHGQAGWHAHAFPLSVDGLVEIVASLVLLVDQRSGRRPGWLPWAALVIGTAGSLAANVATAGPGTVSMIIAGWPAAALLCAIKLLTGMLNRPTASPCRPIDDQDGSQEVSRPAVLTTDPPGAVGPAARPASARTPPIASATADRHQELAQPRTPSAEQQPATSLTPVIAELLPAARAARDALHRDGRRLTRDALAARMRRNGFPVRNARLTPVLEALRNEAPTRSPSRPAGETV
jgi:hypothetical protein